MRDHRDGATITLEKVVHFLENPLLERLKALSRRRSKIGIRGYPLPGVLRIQLLNLLPVHAFPISEINLPQRRAQHSGNISADCNRSGCVAGAAQVAAIDRIEWLRAEQVA